MVIAFLRFTHHKWQFYINHRSDILWDVLAVPAGRPEHSICSVCRAKAEGWCAGVFVLLDVIDTALVLRS